MCSSDRPTPLNKHGGELPATDTNHDCTPAEPAANLAIMDTPQKDLSVFSRL